MNQIIAITASTIDGEPVKTVNARDLHDFLNVGKDFSSWIKSRIEQYNFSENSDFVLVESKPNIGRPSTDYHISTDMAKELSMVERTDKGKIARQYFIACERAAKSAAIVNKEHPAVRALSIFSDNLKQLTTSGIQFDVAFRMANYAAFLATNVSFMSLDDLDTKMPAAPVRRAPSVRTAATRAATPRTPEPKVSTEGFYTAEVLAKRKGTSVENVNILLEGNKLHMRMPNGEYVMKPAAQTKKVGMRRLGVNLWHDTAFS